MSKKCMMLRPLIFSLVIVGLALGVRSSSSQTLTKAEQARLFAQVAEDEQAVAACAKATRDEQIEQFGKPLPRISGHCWDGCPIKVVKPYYPEVARQLGVKGEVLIDTIVDEKGNVVFANFSRGNSLFRKAALDAAYVSQYQPKVTCGNQPIKFRWTIKYYFRPDM